MDENSKTDEPTVARAATGYAAEALEVDMYVMGRYVGKRKVARDSICGALLAGSSDEAKRRGEELQNEMDRLTES